eukprot:759456-Lingulodinium_polyedra.AAC.1
MPHNCTVQRAPDTGATLYLPFRASQQPLPTPRAVRVARMPDPGSWCRPSFSCRAASPPPPRPAVALRPDRPCTTQLAQAC